VEIPVAVYVIWWITLAVAVVVVLPLAVYLLHRTLRAARQIERYAARALEAGVGIAGNTENISALEGTISTATGILETAHSIEQRTGTIEEVFETRTGGRSQ
jgi:ABC-type multidrug transport system fused ATPase/permease subunit